MSAFQRSIMMVSSGMNIVTASDAENVNLRTLLNAKGFNNNIPTTITYTVAAGATITSSSGNGTSVPAWQTGDIASIHTLNIEIFGAIKGFGGAGGPTMTGSGTGSVGSEGGTAMNFECDATLIVSSGASVLAGGGGGGSGGSAQDIKDNTASANGGAGGLGAGTASAASGVAGQTDTDGDATAQSGSGGDGGAHGQDGNAGQDGQQGTGRENGFAGGSKGYALKKNSNTISLTNNGTVTGTQG